MEQERLSSLGCYEIANRLLQSGKPMLHYLPHQVEVHAEVLVDQYVAEAGDLLPRHMATPTTEGARHILGRLANDLEVPENGIPNHRLGPEALPSPLGIRLDEIDGVENVAQVRKIIRHRGTASRRTRSRT